MILTHNIFYGSVVPDHKIHTGHRHIAWAWPVIVGKILLTFKCNYFFNNWNIFEQNSFDFTEILGKGYFRDPCTITTPAISFDICHDMKV